MRRKLQTGDEPVVANDRAGSERPMLMRFAALMRREEGQTMAEYAVVLGIITVATIAVFTALSGGIQAAIQNAVNTL
jgi:Flp pilus assembly pilin Flp